MSNVWNQMARWLDYKNEIMFCVKDLNPSGIYADVDIYTRIAFKRLNINWINDFLVGLEHKTSTTLNTLSFVSPGITCSCRASLTTKQNVHK